jgi:hypothetical protein
MKCSGIIYRPNTIYITCIGEQRRDKERERERESERKIEDGREIKQDLLRTRVSVRTMFVYIIYTPYYTYT